MAINNSQNRNDIEDIRNILEQIKIIRNNFQKLASDSKTLNSIQTISKNLKDFMYIKADVFAGNKIEGLNLLGSPFTLDASFHAACVWSQCFLGFIAFPVSITKRVILKPTVFGNTYKAQVLPVSGDTEKVMFDVFIYDRTDDICEIVTGIKMIDVSGGRLRPSEWIRFSTP